MKSNSYSVYPSVVSLARVFKTEGRRNMQVFKVKDYEGSWWITEGKNFYRWHSEDVSEVVSKMGAKVNAGSRVVRTDDPSGNVPDLAVLAAESAPARLMPVCVKSSTPTILEGLSHNVFAFGSDNRGSCEDWLAVPEYALAPVANMGYGIDWTWRVATFRNRRLILGGRVSHITGSGVYAGGQYFTPVSAFVPVNVGVMSLESVRFAANILCNGRYRHDER